MNPRARFEVVFDTIETTLKARILRLNPRAALVIGGWAPGDDNRDPPEIVEFPGESLVL